MTGTSRVQLRSNHEHVRFLKSLQLVDRAPIPLRDKPGCSSPAFAILLPPATISSTNFPRSLEASTWVLKSPADLKARPR